MNTVDYIVIGAGSAGCVVARRICEYLPDARVVILEAGKQYPSDSVVGARIQTPGDFELLQRTEADWNYHTEPEPAITRPDRNVYWPRGKALGGSSVLSSMVYIRGNRRDYDRWARTLNDESWEYRNLLKYFMKSERNLRKGISRDFHGSEGLMCVRDIPEPNPASIAFINAAVAAGYGCKDDFNAFEQEGGAGLYQVNIDECGERVSAASAFLSNPPENLQIKTNALATKIIFECRRAVAVEYDDSGTGSSEIKRLRVNREIVVACGTVNTPALLLHSGVGPAAQLKRLSIPVVHELNGVGENLQDHSISAVVNVYRPGVEMLGASAGVAEAGLFLRLHPNSTSPDIQFQFTHRILGAAKGVLPESGFMIVPTLLSPKSRGTIRLRTSNIRDAPEIRANYLTSKSDLDTLVEGVKIARSISKHEPLSSLGEYELAPGGGTTTDEELASYVRSTASGLFHPVGTCRMGVAGDPFAVVDSSMRIHGLEQIRIADASVFPIIPSGNTHAPTVMIGEKVAVLIAKDCPTVGPVYTVVSKTYMKNGDQNMPHSQLPILGEFPKFFSTDSRETIFLRFAEGVGEVRPDGKGLSIRLRMFTADGQPDGSSVCSGEVRANGLNEFLDPPKNPIVRFGEPGPIAEVPVTSICQASWTFKDGSSLTAIGKGTSHIVPLSNQPGMVNPGIMKDRVAMIVTGGTGRFEGANGGVTIDSSVLLDDAMRPPVGQPGAKLTQKSLVVFSVVAPNNH